MKGLNKVFEPMREEAPGSPIVGTVGQLERERKIRRAGWEKGGGGTEPETG